MAPTHQSGRKGLFGKQKRRLLKQKHKSGIHHQVQCPGTNMILKYCETCSHDLSTFKNTTRWDNVEVSHCLTRNPPSIVERTPRCWMMWAGLICLKSHRHKNMKTNPITIALKLHHGYLRRGDESQPLARVLVVAREEGGEERAEMVKVCSVFGGDAAF